MAVAEVYKNGVRAATLERETDGTTFAYLPEYLASRGPEVATTLPLSDVPVRTPTGSVPPYFAGLLPEGRRFQALVGHLKISADDEFAMLVAVGSNTVGDVQVLPGEGMTRSDPEVVEMPPDLSSMSFDDLLRGRPEMAAIAGVQDKVSSAMINLPAKFAGREFILKLNPPEYPFLVENEAYFLALAGRSGLRPAKATIIHDAQGEAGLLVERFDRGPEGLMHAMEDGCQAANRWPADKYLIPTEQLIDVLATNCSAPRPAALDLFNQVVFAVATGNGDAHAKNFSIIRINQEWRTAPAYDLPSSVFYGDNDIALSIGNGKQAPGRRKLLKLAEAVDIPEVLASRVIGRILRATENMFDEIKSGAIGFDQHRMDSGIKLLQYRRRQLERR